MLKIPCCETITYYVIVLWGHKGLSDNAPSQVVLFVDVLLLVKLCVVLSRSHGMLREFPHQLFVRDAFCEVQDGNWRSDNSNNMGLWLWHECLFDSKCCFFLNRWSVCVASVLRQSEVRQELELTHSWQPRQRRCERCVAAVWRFTWQPPRWVTEETHWLFLASLPAQHASLQNTTMVTANSNSHLTQFMLMILFSIRIGVLIIFPWVNMCMYTGMKMVLM